MPVLFDSPWRANYYNFGKLDYYYYMTKQLRFASCGPDKHIGDFEFEWEDRDFRLAASIAVVRTQRDIV